jgi:hypothetical protein
MPQRTRLAGIGRDRLGREVTWTIADGERGRRWRETVAEPAGGMARSVTLETGHAGQWLRLEMAAPAGLLSLHPDRGGSVHGNVVSRDGVRHLSLDALDPPLVDIRDSVVGETALCRALERRVAAGEGTTVSVARVGPGLEVTTVEVAVVRQDARTWELRDPDGTRAVAMGDLGTPANNDVGARWPLETGS